MSQELVNKELGGEGELDLSLENGKLKLSVKYAGKGGDATVSAALNPDYFLDKLAAAIPGGIDDAVINILKAALKMG